MTITASDIIYRVRDIVMDADSIRWSDAELLRWLTDAERAIVGVIPSASQLSYNLSLVAGARQTIPSDGVRLLRAYQNVGGSIVHEVEWELLNRQYPTFTTDPQVTSVVVYAFDPNDPEAFYVYPPNDGLGEIVINYSVYPPALAATTDTLAVRDIFETALLDYVLYRAHSKDSDYAAGDQIAIAYLESFKTFVAAQAGG